MVPRGGCAGTIPKRAATSRSSPAASVAQSRSTPTLRAGGRSDSSPYGPHGRRRAGGAKTNYDRLILEIWTNGTISPEMALVEAAKILRKHLNAFVQYFEPGDNLGFTVRHPAPRGERRGGPPDSAATLDPRLLEGRARFGQRRASA